MKMMRWKSLMGWAGILAAAGWCLVSCEGLSVSMSPDGKFSVSGTVPVERGKVVVGKGGK